MTHTLRCDSSLLVHGIKFNTVHGFVLAFSAQTKTNARIYPAYHTAYDTFDYCSRYIDPGECAACLTQFQPVQ